VPGGLAQPGADAEGIEPDGWMAQTAHVRLRGGPPAELVIRGETPVTGQRVVVAVNGTAVATEDLAPGAVDLRILVPRSAGGRGVDLRFARVTKLKPPDTRSAAARLSSIRIAALRTAPRSVALPGALASRKVRADGVFADGWVGRRSTFALAGGGAAALVLRGSVPPPPGGSSQRLRVAVDGSVVVDQPVTPGPLAVRVPVEPSPSIRLVSLVWASAAPASTADPREVAARLTSIGVVRSGAVAVLHVPGGLSGRVAYSGIYADGWAQRDVRVLLAGGGTAVLTLDCETILKQQRLDVLVDGTHVVSTDLARGTDSVQVPVAPSAGPRLVELRFGAAEPISANDPRVAAALLHSIGVSAPGPAPASVPIPSSLGSGLTYSGIYRDGWAQQDVRVVLAGGNAAALTVKAQTIAKNQRMTVVVDGATLGTAKLRPGDTVVHVQVPATSMPARLLELRFARAVRISPQDGRHAATLLQSIAIG
jgi:hypothetical protein